MTASTADAPARALHAAMAAAGMQPLWDLAGDLLPAEPRPRARPHRWDGTAMLELVERAGHLIPLDRIGDRRAVALANPGLGGAPWATPTLWAALQLLNPGESAPAHRHSAAAIRFVLRGQGVWTTVDGDECTMHPGDLVLTPAWAWHEHTSDGDAPMVWLDGLDLPLVHALDAMFHQLHPTGRQAVVGRDRSVEVQAAGVRPRGERARLLVYRWSATDRALAAQLHAGAAHARVEFTDPRHGGPVLPTLGCAMWRLPAGHRTQAEQRCASSVYLVTAGSGRTIAGGVELPWQAGDLLAIPSWAQVEHHAAEPSDLFELTDEPVLRALGLYQEAGALPR